MNILLIGPQGSGKGTQARIIIEKFNLFYFESGAYLRRMAENHPDVKKIMDEGELVPDEEFTSYLTAYLDEQDLYDNILFDGFPRTVAQYDFFKKWLTDKEVSLDLGIVLQISEEETLRRLSSRRLDPSTGKIYNLVTEPPPTEVDVNKLVQRDDDKPEAIRKRLELYRQQTEPLIARLKIESEVIEVNGERPIDAISQDLIKLIEERMN
ncbi:MAG: nucleoside monophosphate kinase, partial [Candidatus Woesebacteria bacterium]|nr:nucleoside monophosphate kinase [Candidatus Woesebacteria bacterium]